MARVLVGLGAVVLTVLPQVTIAASSWKPTLLVNTESFQTIDEGDSSTDVEVRFGGTLNEKLIWNRTEGTFQFTDDLSVQGVLSGATLRVDGYADFWGNLAASGSIQADNNITANGRLSGTTLRVSSGGADIQGNLTVSGSLRGDGNFTINDDRTASANAVLTFGNETTNQTLTYVHSLQKFQFSKDLSVIGNLSGSTLTVDGNANVRGELSASGAIRTEGSISGATLNIGGAITLRNITYNAPTAQGGSNTFLRNDGAGGLSWTTTSVGNGSGLIMSMHPEYPNAVYFSSGSSYIGQLYGSGGTSGLDNSYVWTSTKSGIQDYWISVRFRVPDNFSSWDIMKPIEFRYKTGTATAAENHLTVRMRDTAGAIVALTGGGGLASASWATANITGPQAGGTWTPKGYATLYVKVASTSTAGANAAAGFVNLNFETTTP